MTYMPYLHGKREELLAVAEMGATLQDFVIPIFKPVDSSVSNTAKRLARIGAETRFAVITNSDKGPHRPPSYDDIVRMLSRPEIQRNAENLLPAFELRGGTRLADFDRFCRDFSNFLCVVVHKGHAFGESDLAGAMEQLSVAPVHVFVEPGVSPALFPTLPSAAKITLRDGFCTCARNCDYPAQSAFDGIAFDYKTRGFQGFGDFCLIGDRYSATGGRAHAVALHLSEVNGQALVANHFISTSPGVDTPTMYFEALDALASYAGTPPRNDLDTQGVREYLESRRTQHYGGLGLPKRWSTMHHIETVQTLLSAQGESAAF
jgi:hypothetical protein